MSKVKAFLRGQPVLIAWFLFSLAMKHLGMIQAPDGANLDWYLNLRDQPEGSAVDRTVLVLVDDDDYQNPKLFDGRSPLNPTLVVQILDLIQAGKPAVTVMDLDTSASAYRALKSRVHPEARVVWARDAAETLTPWSLSAFLGTRTKDLKPQAFFGGIEETLRAGLAILPLDHDGVMRRHIRHFPTPDGPKPSLGFEALTQFCATQAGVRFASRCRSIQECAKQLCDRAGLIGFPVEGIRPFSLSAGALLELSYAQGWDPEALFGGRVVLLGGVYPSSRDFFPTPVVGTMPGVEVWSNVIAAELGNQMWEPWSPVMVWVFEISALLILAWLSEKWVSQNAWLHLVLTFGAVLSFSAGLSLLVFHSVWGLGSFFVTMAGVFVSSHHRLAEQALEQHLKQE